MCIQRPEDTLGVTLRGHPLFENLRQGVLQLRWKGILAVGCQEILQSHTVQQTSEIYWEGRTQEGGCLCLGKRIEQKTGNRLERYIYNRAGYEINMDV